MNLFTEAENRDSDIESEYVDTEWEGGGWDELGE